MRPPQINLSPLFLAILLTGAASAAEPTDAPSEAPDKVVSATGDYGTNTSDSSSVQAVDTPGRTATDPGDTSTDPTVTGSAAASPEPERNLQAEIDDAQARYTDAFAAEQYQPAIAAAQQLVALTGEINGTDAVEYAGAISQLAAAQSKNGDLAAASANYRKAIVLIEEQEGIVDPQLIEPLTGLASVQNATGEWHAGLETYGRALRLNHVEHGLNNLAQMPIRDGLTESHLGLGNIEDANFQQEIQLRIVSDEYGKYIDTLLQASNKLANWYDRTDQNEKQVILLESTVSKIRNKAGDDTVMQIKTLRELSAAYQQLDLPQEEELNVYSAALDALEEAWRINNASAHPDALLSADLQVAMGDVHSYYGATYDARDSYTDAWKTLVAAGASEDVFDGYFGTPTLVGPVKLPSVFPDDSDTREAWQSDPDRFKPGTLQAIVDVTDRGRTENIRIIESDPEGLLDDRARYLLKRYQYRPRFVDGLAIATQDVSINHAYSYLPDQKGNHADSDNSESETGERLAYPGAAN